MIKCDEFLYFCKNIKSSDSEVLWFDQMILNYIEYQYFIFLLDIENVRYY